VAALLVEKMFAVYNSLLFTELAVNQYFFSFMEQIMPASLPINRAFMVAYCLCKMAF